MPHICSCPYNLVSGKDVPRPARGKVGQAPVRGSQEVPVQALHLSVVCLAWKLHPRKPVVVALKATDVATQALKTGGMLRCSLKEEEDDKRTRWAMVWVELSQSVKDDGAVLQQLQGRNGPQLQFLIYG